MQHVILIRSKFGTLYGAILCKTHSKQIKLALENGAESHRNLDNEGGDYLSYILEYMPTELKDKIDCVIRNISIAEV